MPTKVPDHPSTGRCLCGAVRYEVGSVGPRMAHCHCSMCRRFHGAAFATFGECPAEAFRWLTGEDRLASYRAPNGTTRRFCRDCGSSLTYAPAGDDGATVQFALGTLDGDPGHRPDAHIFVGSKACWFEIRDDLTRHDRHRS